MAIDARLSAHLTLSSFRDTLSCESTELHQTKIPVCIQDIIKDRRFIERKALVHLHRTYTEGTAILDGQGAQDVNDCTRRSHCTAKAGMH